MARVHQDTINAYNDSLTMFEFEHQAFMEYCELMALKEPEKANEFYDIMMRKDKEFWELERRGMRIFEESLTAGSLQGTLSGIIKRIKGWLR